MLGLLEILEVYRFVLQHRRVKLVRHKDKRRDLEMLARSGWLETYQKYQDRAVFDHCDQIVVFVGEDGTSGRFVGIYDVEPRASAADFPLSNDFPIRDFYAPSDFFYPLEKRSGFEDLEDRLIIEWGPGALAWAQWLTNRKVLEIRHCGHAIAPFGD